MIFSGNDAAKKREDSNMGRISRELWIVIVYHERWPVGWLLEFLLTKLRGRRPPLVIDLSRFPFSF